MLFVVDSFGNVALQGRGGIETLDLPRNAQ